MPRGLSTSTPLFRAWLHDASAILLGLRWPPVCFPSVFRVRASTFSQALECSTRYSLSSSRFPRTVFSLSSARNGRNSLWTLTLGSPPSSDVTQQGGSGCFPAISSHRALPRVALHTDSDMPARRCARPVLERVEAPLSIIYRCSAIRAIELFEIGLACVELKASPSADTSRFELSTVQV